MPKPSPNHLLGNPLIRVCRGNLRLPFRLQNETVLSRPFMTWGLLAVKRADGVIASGWSRAVGWFGTSNGRKSCVRVYSDEENCSRASKPSFKVFDTLGNRKNRNKARGM